jgi:hypothetical protein
MSARGVPEIVPIILCFPSKRVSVQHGNKVAGSEALPIADFVAKQGHSHSRVSSVDDAKQCLTLPSLEGLLLR